MYFFVGRIYPIKKLANAPNEECPLDSDRSSSSSPILLLVLLAVRLGILGLEKRLEAALAALAAAVVLGDFGIADVDDLREDALPVDLALPDDPLEPVDLLLPVDPVEKDRLGNRFVGRGLLLAVPPSLLPLPVLLLLEKVCRGGMRGNAAEPEAPTLPEPPDDFGVTVRLGVRGAPVLESLLPLSLLFLMPLLVGVMAPRSDFPLSTRSGFRGGDFSTVRALPLSVRGVRRFNCPVLADLVRLGSDFSPFNLDDLEDLELLSSLFGGGLNPCLTMILRTSATNSAISFSSCIPFRQAIRCVLAVTSRQELAILS